MCELFCEKHDRWGSRELSSSRPISLERLVKVGPIARGIMTKQYDLTQETLVQRAYKTLVKVGPIARGIIAASNVLIILLFVAVFVLAAYRLSAEKD